jgi:hypothetical protein
MKGGATVTNLQGTSKWEHMMAELKHPDKIAAFMHGIYDKLKVKIGDHPDLNSCVEHIKGDDRFKTVLCYISLKPVDHLMNKLDLLKEMALVAEEEIKEKQLKLGHRENGTRKEYLVAYVKTVESEEGITEERKREIKLLKVISFLPEWGHHLLGLFRLDEKMEEIKAEKEKLRIEMTKLQSKATEKAHELGEKAHELQGKATEKAHELQGISTEKAHELLDEIHAKDYVKQLRDKSDTIKAKLKEKGVSEELVQKLFEKVQKDIVEKVEGEVPASLDDKLHIIKEEEKVLEEILRKKLAEAERSKEQIEEEVILLVNEVKEHVVALHIHERLHMVHKIGVEIFMGLLLISIFVEDFTEETEEDIQFTHLPIKAVALLKALSGKTLGSAIDFALRGALRHFEVSLLNESLMGVCAKILDRSDIKDLDQAAIEKLVQGLNDKDKGRIIYAYNHKRFTEGLASSGRGVVQGISDTAGGFEKIFGEDFFKLLAGEEKSS